MQVRFEYSYDIVPNQVLGVPFAWATDPERVLTSAVSGEVTERNLDSWILTVGVPVKVSVGLLVSSYAKHLTY